MADIYSSLLFINQSVEQNLDLILNCFFCGILLTVAMQPEFTAVTINQPVNQPVATLKNQQHTHFLSGVLTSDLSKKILRCLRFH